MQPYSVKVNYASIVLLYGIIQSMAENKVRKCNHVFEIRRRFSYNIVVNNRKVSIYLIVSSTKNELTNKNPAIFPNEELIKVN